MGSINGTKSRNRLPLLVAICTALITVTLATASPAGANVETGVMYTCPEGSEGTPSETFPFCSVFSEEEVPAIILTKYTCPNGTEPSGGAGPSLTCKPNGALGSPGAHYFLVDPIVTDVYSCPAGSSGKPSEKTPFCIRNTPSKFVPDIVKAIVETVTSCPVGSKSVGSECRRKAPDVPKQVTKTYSCPAGAVAEGKLEADFKCIRPTETLVPAIETVVPLCDGVVPTIIGTEGNDEIVGTENADVILGLGGNDLIRGLGGNDVICAGDGADRVYSGDGRDYVDGGAGRDHIRGGRQADTIHGGDNGDKIWGNAGADVLHGDAGNDRIIGNVGDDVVIGGRGRVDVLDGRSGVDSCSDSQANTIRRECE